MIKRKRKKFPKPSPQRNGLKNKIKLPYVYEQVSPDDLYNFIPKYIKVQIGIAAAIISNLLTVNLGHEKAKFMETHTRRR